MPISLDSSSYILGVISVGIPPYFGGNTIYRNPVEIPLNFKGISMEFHLVPKLNYWILVTCWNFQCKKGSHRLEKYTPQNN